MADIYIWPHQAAKILHVSVQSVRGYCKQGLLPYIKTPGGQLRVLRKSVLDFVSNQEKTTGKLAGLRS